MINQEVMASPNGAMCLHCGTVRIPKGEVCLAVTTPNGGGYIAFAHKDLHPLTKGFVLPPPSVPIPGH